MVRFHINNVKLRNKLLIVYILSVFIPITLTNIIFYQVITENVRTQKIHDLSLALEQIANDFSLGIEDAVGVSSVLYTDNLLYSFLEREYESDIEFILAYNSFFRDINKYTPIYSSIHSISLYTDNNTVIYAGGINRISEQLKQTKWYKNMLNARSLYPIVTRTKGDSGKLDTFSVIRELSYFSENSTQKIIKIDLSPSSIEQIFQNITFQGDIYLVNGDGRIEYTTDQTINWKEEHYQFDKLSIPDEMVLLEQEYSIQYINDWKVVGIVSEEALLEDVRGSRNFIIYLALANIILPSLIIIFITNNIHIRLAHILRHMRKMNDQNFKLVKGVEYQDEIGELTSEFNRMTKKIKGLINDVYVASIQKKDLELQRKQAQLSALQSQINPHFLFNVLETIRMRSLMKDEHETSKIIHNMAKILRRSIVWGKDWVTVKEEIHLIQSFLEIQHYRFDDKMQYHIDVDESVNKCLIPNMSIIPFVENASIHGIEPLKHNGMITIKIRRQGATIVCEIKDNGVGIEEGKYQKLLKSLEEEELIGEHVGMKNVYYRFKMHYQERFDFELKSSKENGTIVKIILPYQE